MGGGNNKLIRFVSAMAIILALCGACAAAVFDEPEYLQKEIAAMGTVPVGTWLAISKEHFTLFVMDGNKVIESFGVAVGENKGQKLRAGDHRTPSGMFAIIQIQDSSRWTHDFSDGKGQIKGAYGPWFMRLETGWKGIGIHGTHNPGSIGKNATEGCIRLRNEELQRLREKYAKIGLKVLILE